MDVNVAEILNNSGKRPVLVNAGRTLFLQLLKRTIKLFEVKSRNGR